MLFFILLMFFQPVPAVAQDIAVADDGLACFNAAVEAEKNYQIKKHLLVSISKVETGRWNEQLQQKTAWPWTVNVAGKGYFYKSKKEAVAAVKDWQSKGYDSIDVGCMQVNLRFHGNKFASIEDALDPKKNVDVAAKFLLGRYKHRKDWLSAAADYHSKRPSKARTYKQKVLASLSETNMMNCSVDKSNKISFDVKYAQNLLFNLGGFAKAASGFKISLRD
jgi:hypothetical protein